MIRFFCFEYAVSVIKTILKKFGTEFVIIYIVTEWRTKMKLYHATERKNKESILINGLIPTESTKVSNDPRLHDCYVYGFDNLQDAVDFMVWDNNTDIEDVIVFTFETEEAIEDTEYDGNSFATKSYTNLTMVKKLY